MADGVISQALQNLQVADAQIAALTGLPPDAEAIRQAAHGRIAVLVPVVVQAATAVRGFAPSAASMIQTAKAALDSGDAAVTVRALQSLQQAAQHTAAPVVAASQAISIASDEAHAQAVRLAQTEAALQIQIAQANAQLAAEQNSADELDKKKLYWLALGPLGLIGLGICIGMIVSTQNKVNAMLAQVSALRTQVAAWTKMKADMDVLAGDLPVVAQKLQALQNGIGFLTGDLGNVLNDLQHAGAQSQVARLYLTAAQSEVSTLAVEAG